MAPTQTLNSSEYEFIRQGCATGDPDCRHGDKAITVIFAGQRLTSCIATPDGGNEPRP